MATTSTASPDQARDQAHVGNPQDETTLLAKSFAENSPFCIVVLSRSDSNGSSFQVEHVNSTFEKLISPRYKINEALKGQSIFKVLTTTDKGHDDLVSAVEEANSSADGADQSRVRAR
eukprot:15343695-Ditylum_brightwellii.AAC.1